MLTKNRKRIFVGESINPENGLIFFGDGVEKTRQLTVKKAKLTVVEEPELTVNETTEDVLLKRKVYTVQEYVNNTMGFRPTEQWVIAHLDDFAFYEPEEEERITLEGDIDVEILYKNLQDCLTKLVCLRTQITPLVKKMLNDLPEFNLNSLVENTEQFLSNQFGMETIKPINHYEHIFKFEEFYCNLGKLAPINEYFRAYWLFMWFEKRASIPIPNLSLGDIPKDKILKYLDTKFCVKNLKVPSKKEAKQEYFYQLYLQVKPYLVHYFALEKFEQKELFTYEI